MEPDPIDDIDDKPDGVVIVFSDIRRKSTSFVGSIFAIESTAAMSNLFSEKIFIKHRCGTKEFFYCFALHPFIKICL